MDDKKLAEEQNAKEIENAKVKVYSFLFGVIVFIAFLFYLMLPENPNSKSSVAVCKGLTVAECEKVVKDTRWLKENGYLKK